MNLRKLTRLSKIGFSYLSDYTVGDLLKIGKCLSIVRLYYYNSHITFFDDILEEVGITNEWRIEKPGIDKKKYSEFGNTLYPEEMQQRYKNAIARHRRESKLTLALINIHSKDKSFGQRINHGHGLRK